LTVETKNPTSTSGRWMNGENAYSSNDVYASNSLRPNEQNYENYGFSLGESTIEKVEVGIEFYCAADEGVRLQISYDGGSTYSDWSKIFTLTEEDIIWVNYTSLTDWTPDKLSDANLRVRIDFKPEGGSGCFAPDTLIGMADGSVKRIVDVELGEKVLTKDGVGVVTAKTTHKSLKGYPMVKFKGVTMFKTHLFWADKAWHTLPSILETVILKEIVNIETDKKSLFANGMLVHNIEKLPYTAYLDWIPVRVTYSSAVTAKGFSDSGGGSESFVNPYRAMGFTEVGGGSESFGIPFKSLAFSEVGAGADVFGIPWKALGFSDAGYGTDAFIKEVLGAIAKGFSDSGLGTDSFAKVITLLSKGFSDSGTGIDSFAKLITLLSKAFSDSGLGTDVFSVIFKALKFNDTGSGVDVFATPYREMDFSDIGSGVDVFKLLREVAFLDSALGTDVFTHAVLGAILKEFSDNGLGVDVFAKVWSWLPWVQRTYENVFARVKVDLEATTSIKNVILGEPLKLTKLPVAIINPTRTSIAQIALERKFENTIGFTVLLLIRESEPSNWFTDIITVMADVVDALLTDHTLNGIVVDVAPVSFEPGRIKIMQKVYYGGMVRFEAKLCYAA